MELPVLSPTKPFPTVAGCLLQKPCGREGEDTELGRGKVELQCKPQSPQVPSPYFPIKWFSSEWEGAIAGKGLPTVPSTGCYYHNLFPC